MPYPEHEKLRALAGANQTVGNFIEWLAEKSYTICEPASKDWRYDPGGQYMPIHQSRDALIAAFFEIDAAELSREKDRMLDEFRCAQVVEASSPKPATP